jgi:predicted acyltransferase
MSQETASSNPAQIHDRNSDQAQESGFIETKHRPSGNGTVAKPASPQGRLSSLDALRGFDMFWITGGTAILMGLGKVIHRPFFDRFLDQFSHVPWQGLHLYDLIWPLFMFIMGVAIPLSITSRRAKGATDRSLLLHAVRRAIILFFLGTITQGNLLLFDLSKFRPCYSVLHGLAAGYLIATVVALKVKPSRHVAVIGGFLLAYWALVMLIPVPGFGAGVLTPQGNAATYIDQLVLGRFHYGENTWFLSYLGFGASVLLGVLAGQVLQSNLAQGKKILRLLLMGSVSLVVGFVWSLWFPVIKLMWTSSYVLISGGISFLVMALFYWIMDVRGYKKWAFGFVVIGMNAIFVYFTTEVFDFRLIGNVLVGHLLPRLGRWDSLVEASAAFAVVWFILYWMYRKREFVRI